jgi:hypothetical protein
MMQPAMEQAIGKLVVDRGFRDAFFRDPAAASEAVGIRLTADESGALARIRPGAFAAFARYLDAKRLDWPGRVTTSSHGTALIADRR